MSTWTAPESGWYEVPSMRKLSDEEVRVIEADHWQAPEGTLAVEFDTATVFSAARQDVELPSGQVIPPSTWTKLI